MVCWVDEELKNIDASGRYQQFGSNPSNWLLFHLMRIP